MQSEDIEDDQVIVIEGEQGDDFSQNMLDYFKVAPKLDEDKKPLGLVNNKA
jgi:hypothetical protein